MKVNKINKRKFKRFKKLLKYGIGNALTVTDSTVVSDGKTEKTDINGCYERCTHSENQVKLVFRSKSNSLLTRGHVFYKHSTRG